MVEAPEEKIKGSKKKYTRNDDIIKALNPKSGGEQTSNPLNEPKVNIQEDQENILDQLDQFEQPRPVGLEQQELPSSSIKEDEENLLEEAPLPPSSQPTYYSQVPESTEDFSTEQVEEIAESIVNEKWEEFLTKIGDINLWKENVNNELTAIKQEILRTQDHFNNLQRSVLGKVDEYNQNIGSISTEMKALEKVFQKILQPLTSNIKELSRITEKLKKKAK